MIILGIDPGTATTGYGVVRAKKINCRAKKNLKCLDYGVIKTSPLQPTGERLKKINNELDKLIKKYRPKVLAIESLYFFKNLKTALPVSQAKGVILLTAAKKRVPVQEFTPLQVKMIVAGYGRAEKAQVQEKIRALLSLENAPKSDDAADALATALSYVFIKRA